jgi:ParB family chromosome partitioning protein
MIQQQNPNKKKLTSLNEMFGDMSGSTAVMESKSDKISTELLIPFRDHPFKPYTGQRFDDLVRSVKELGVLQPIIIRPIPNRLESEILAGHNRWRAAQAAGIREVPYVKMEGLSEAEAMLVVTETNLIQRSFADLLHSEKAFVLAQHYAAMKSQGKRIDIINELKMLLNADKIRENETFRPVGEKFHSDDKTGKEYGLSGRSVSRYLRINELDDDLKKWIDEETISIRAGVELSYLGNDNQMYLIDILNNNKVKIDEKLASELRALEEQGKLNEKSMIQVITGTYKKVKKEASVLKGIKVKPIVMKKYFNDRQSIQEVEQIIDKALELYFQSKSTQEDARE